MMKHAQRIDRWLLMVLILATVAPPVLADDLYPPSWRGQPGTLTAGWDNWWGFPGPMSPDWWSQVPYSGQPGVNQPSAIALGNSTRTHVEGNWYINQLAPIEFDLDNFDGAKPVKDVWFQLTYSVPNSFQAPRFMVTTPGGSFTTTGTFVTRIDLNPLDVYYTDVFTFQIQPNPDWETIKLEIYDKRTGQPWYPAYVDQVVIDTRCFPEPATLGLLAIGGWTLLRRRR